jgi:hypothetical protein
MSLKRTIALGENFHFYAEALCETEVFLELRHCDRCGQTTTTAIPVAIWESIRHATAFRYDYAGLSDEEIKALCQKGVAERMVQINAAIGTPSEQATKQLVGSRYGDWSDPVEQQVATGVRLIKKFREEERATLVQADSYKVVEL